MSALAWLQGRVGSPDGAPSGLPGGHADLGQGRTRPCIGHAIRQRPAQRPHWTAAERWRAAAGAAAEEKGSALLEVVTIVLKIQTSVPSGQRCRVWTLGVIQVDHHDVSWYICMGRKL